MSETKPRYPEGCSAGSEVRGQARPPDASDPADYAWFVDFNNGNANINDRDNHGYVLAVRGGVPSPGEYQGAVTFPQLLKAWERARKQKCSYNQLAFENNWLDNLLQLERDINAFAWMPRPTVCFVATRPKAREIHAPDFSDRVVHHWLVPQLEAIYEPTFIHDSFSNRKDKGTHAAVERLRSFVREVRSGQGRGWYLQLDIHNFFNSIHRPTLWKMLKRRLSRHGVCEVVLRATHALLRQSPVAQGVRHRGRADAFAQVPAHKRLANAAPGCGIAIGNYSSQFLANVYLDRLDQFVKHALKVPRYIRYVDDFVLIHESREQLEAWQAQIERFLAETLRLRLKEEVRLRPLGDGIDFLGYVVYPTHSRVRRRVISHAREKLKEWQRRHVRLRSVCATPAQFREVRSIWASYQGHYSHANSRRLQADFHRRFPWLRIAADRRRFDYRLEGTEVEIARRTAG